MPVFAAKPRCGWIEKLQVIAMAEQRRSLFKIEPKIYGAWQPSANSVGFIRESDAEAKFSLNQPVPDAKSTATRRSHKSRRS